MLWRFTHFILNAIYHQLHNIKIFKPYIIVYKNKIVHLVSLKYPSHSFYILASYALFLSFSNRCFFILSSPPSLTFTQLSFPSHPYSATTTPCFHILPLSFRPSSFPYYFPVVILPHPPCPTIPGSQTFSLGLASANEEREATV